MPKTTPLAASMYPLCLAPSSQLTVGSSTAGKTAPRQDLNQVPLVSQSWSSFIYFLFIFLQNTTHHLTAQSSKAAMRHMEWQEWGRGRGSLTDHRVSASLQPKRSTKTKDYRKYAGGGGDNWGLRGKYAQ